MKWSYEGCAASAKLHIARITREVAGRKLPGKEVVAQFSLFRCVILSEAVVQAERRILRGASVLHARSLAPLVKTRGFGKTPKVVEFKLGHCGRRSLAPPQAER